MRTDQTPSAVLYRIQKDSYQKPKTQEAIFLNPRALPFQGAVSPSATRITSVGLIRYRMVTNQPNLVLPSLLSP